MSGQATTIYLLAVVLIAVIGLLGWSMWAFFTETVRLKDELSDTKASLESVRSQRDQCYERYDQQAGESMKSKVDALYESVPPMTPNRAELIDQILSRDADDLERAQGAWSRLKERTQIELSAHPDGSGPLFSASKSAMAERALLTIVRQSVEAEEDWDIASKWLVEHPGQYDKLG